MKDAKAMTQLELQEEVRSLRAANEDIRTSVILYRRRAIQAECTLQRIASGNDGCLAQTYIAIAEEVFK